MLNEIQNRIIVFLGSCDNSLKNIYAISAKFDKSYSSMYQHIRILEAKGIIRNVKVSGKTSYQITNEGILEEAKAYLEKCS